MLTRRGLVAALGGVFIGGCGGPTYRYRYRLSLFVDTPEGVRSGSAVRQCIAYEFVSLGSGGMGANTAVKGEAAVVDLGERGFLFSLLVGPGGAADCAAHLPQQVFARAGLVKLDYSDAPTTPQSEIFKRTQRAIMGVRGPVEVRPEELPMLVRFRDIADPRTVERVRPDDLASTFGSSVRFARATIEIVDAPVTTGIERRLPFWDGPFPWLKPLGNGAFVDTRTETLRFNKYNFQQGA